jgi:hypothetical protein
MVKWVPMKTNSRGYSFKEGEIYKNMALILVDAENRRGKRRLKRLELKTRRYFTDIDSSKFIFANEGL